VVGWPGLQVDPALASRVVEILARDGQRETAAAALALARRTVGPDARIGPLVRLARSASAVDAGAAASLARAALARPDLPVELRSELAAIAADGTAPEGDADSRPAGDAARLIPQPPHLLQVIAAVPQALDEEVLVIVVDGATRRLGLRRVEAIAVGGVARADKRPMVVVDLLLDAPWSDRSELRVVRLMSADFDPRALPGAQPGGIAGVPSGRSSLRRGAAADPDGARGLPFRAYASSREARTSFARCRALGVAMPGRREPRLGTRRPRYGCPAPCAARRGRVGVAMLWWPVIVKLPSGNPCGRPAGAARASLPGARRRDLAAGGCGARSTSRPPLSELARGEQGDDRGPRCDAQISSRRSCRRSSALPAPASTEAG
jgi:hypothetical protein